MKMGLVNRLSSLPPGVVMIVTSNYKEGLDDSTVKDIQTVNTAYISADGSTPTVAARGSVIYR